LTKSFLTILTMIFLFSCSSRDVREVKSSSQQDTANNDTLDQNKSEVYKKITGADSVVIVSHLTTNVPIAKDKTTGDYISYRLVERNRVNYKILKESLRLNANEIDSIATIITTLHKDSIIEDIQCFLPHHGILIFKKSKCSYFDICFGCRHFETSEDIELSDELSTYSWNALEMFFRNRHLNYELPKKELANDDVQ
jgi:hypothetical protein